MTLIPQIFPSTPEAAIASYSFTDIAEGTGVVVFLGSDTDDDGTVTYSLSQNAVYSANVTTEGNGTSGVEKLIDVDFDVTFNLPKRIKGKIIANIPIISGHESTGNKEGTAYAILKVRHWDGTTETEIASNTKSKVTSGLASSDTQQDVLNVEVDAPQTHFKKGETLRLTVEIWAATQAGSGLQVGLMHDPKNRKPLDYSGGNDTGDFIISILSFNVPFVLDL